jgi:hypothetical protein
MLLYESYVKCKFARRYWGKFRSKIPGKISHRVPDLVEI